MTEHCSTVVFQTNPAAASKKCRPLEQIDASRMARHLVIYQGDGETIARLIPEADARIGSLAEVSVVRRVAAHNPDSFWAIARRTKDFGSPQAEGFVALLFLTREGLNDLAARKFNAHDPDPALLTPAGQRPEAIYVWAAYAEGRLAPAVALVLQKISVPPYTDVPLYARTTTKDGTRFTESLGFRRAGDIGGADASHLYVYERSKSKPTNAPAYDTYHKGADRRTLSVTVARSMEDWLRVASIRSAVYIGEQECPFEEEFDGNDFSAIHLIGYVGDEPSGCIRIRHFAEFAKIERLAVRKEFRNTRLSFQLVKAAIELCRAKGYRRLYGHSQRRLMNFWSRFGFIPMPGGKGFVFSDFDYVEIVLDIEPLPDAIRIGMDPYVIIRPEGRWHEPGILERSAARPVSRPSVGFVRQ
ncbi:MAG: GNAT family N-acetyltransferase [Alphaproteobacteria bacterium]|nr:GNAT family N-acetyltransferase [Alphaproteobacteria bacterium]